MYIFLSVEDNLTVTGKLKWKKRERERETEGKVSEKDLDGKSESVEVLTSHMVPEVQWTESP